MTPTQAAAVLSICASAALADAPGLHITQMFLPHHDTDARVAIWYPSTSQNAATLYANNPVFEGVAAHLDAAVAPGEYPLVLFSHGMGGTDRAQAWLGAALAERGAITVMVNHPNSTWGDFDMSQGVAHWTRAQDLSAAMDALFETPALSDIANSVDPSRVMAAGFSYGGWTALSLGGIKGNHAGIVGACQNDPQMEACDMLLSDDVNLQGIDPVIWNASYADPRVTHVTAIDPGFVWGLQPSDVAALVPAARLVGFGDGADRMDATNFDLSGLTDMLGDRDTQILAPACHFSAMPICTPAGAAILADEEDDPVCTDPAGSDRAAIHAALVAMIAQDLGL